MTPFFYGNHEVDYDDECVACDDDDDDDRNNIIMDISIPLLADQNDYIHFTHMGQNLQDGENGCFMSYFF